MSNERRQGEPARVIGQMRTQERRDWTPPERRRKARHPRQGLKLAGVCAVAFCGLCGGLAVVAPARNAAQAVMSHLTAGFEYDDTLGRLQFVSNVLPESAMVFLTGDSSVEEVLRPVQESAEHVWSQEEPWMEFACSGDVVSCLDGEVMTVVRNRQDEYTVRILHEDGYESVYSGLCEIGVGEGSPVTAGQKLGIANGCAAFELRRDGLSIQPVFSQNR
ncbi:MAG: M23 family metallopeptidase [Candidatus Ventricola sp.]|nr:M23 family metallopeptidase [Candidatus Ventricola sp.]